MKCLYLGFVNKIFEFINITALDLLKCMLQFNPDKRITVEEALKHPYLEHLHCEEDEVWIDSRDELNFFVF